jgi:ribosomal protein S18 acetylase RimI-like enzyme
MKNKLSIRRYRPSDQNQVLGLHKAAMEDVGAFVDGVPDPDLDNIEESYLRSNGEFLIGEVDGEIVAMGAFRSATGYITEFLDSVENAAEIKRMRVKPSYQGRGYGTRILAKLEEKAQERDYTELVLDTRPNQEAAKHLYETNGFKEQSREQLEFENETFTLIFYKKR